MNDKRNKAGKLLRRCAAGLLGLILVFSLIQPGLAGAEQNYICGKEAHTHVDGCYETKTETVTTKVLKCSLDVPAPAAEDEETGPSYVHAHNDDCYEGETLVCPLEEIEAHTHEASCYGTEYQCGKEAVEAHKHSDACQKELICTVTAEDHEHVATCWKAKECTLEETEGHAHSDACGYNLICEKPVVVLHSHTESCYAPVTVAEGEEEQEPKLTCTTPVVENHVHDENCWEEKTEEKEVKTLICGLEEHEHTDACVKKAEEKDEEKKPTYTCGKEEHTHAEGCYDAQNVLTCTLEEHTHTDECAKKVEKKEPTAYETYEKTLADLLTKAEALQKEDTDYETQWEAILKETEALRETMAADCEENGKLTVDEYFALIEKLDEIENLYYENMVPAEESGAFANSGTFASEADYRMYKYVSAKDGGLREDEKLLTTLVNSTYETIPVKQGPMDVQYSEVTLGLKPATSVTVHIPNGAQMPGTCEETDCDQNKAAWSASHQPYAQGGWDTSWTGAPSVVNANNTYKDAITGADGKGGYYVIYHNIGNYADINLKVSIADYQTISSPSESSSETGYTRDPQICLRIQNGKPGVSVLHIAWVRLKYEFLDSAGNHVAVKGNTTYYDVDGSQFVHLNPTDNEKTCKGIYLPNNSVTETHGTGENAITVDGCQLYIGSFKGSTYSTPGVAVFERINRISNLGTGQSPYAFTEIFETGSDGTMYRTFGFMQNQKVTQNDDGSYNPTPDIMIDNVNYYHTDHWAGGLIWNEAVPVDARSGKLTIKKEVVNGDENKEFSFQVELYPALSGTFSGVTFNNGVGSFKLKHNESKTISGLFENMLVTITETVDPQYEVSAEGAEQVTGNSGQPIKGKYSKALLISGDTTSKEENGVKIYDFGTVTFTNTRKTGDLTINKVWAGNAVPTENGTPFFKVSVRDGDGEWRSVNTNQVDGDIATNFVWEIPYGSTVKITEGTTSSSNFSLQDYNVSWEVKVGEETIIPESGTDEKTVQFNFGNNAEVKVTCTNTQKGKLSITKAVEDTGNKLPTGEDELTYTINVVLKKEDGTAIPFKDGATYAVYDVATNTKVGTTDPELGNGVVVLKAGQKAVIDQLPIGAAFTVEEADASGVGFDVDYVVTNDKDDKLTDNTAVEVKNAVDSVEVPVYISKTLPNHDNSAEGHTYYFALLQKVNDSELPVTGVEPVAVTVKGNDGPAKASFTLKYDTFNLLDASVADGQRTKDFNYVIYEMTAAENGEKVTNTGDGALADSFAITKKQEIKVTLTGTKNGITAKTYIGQTEVTNENPVNFENILLKDLTIQKVMKDNYTDIIGTYYMTVEISSDHFKTGMVLDLGYKANATDAANKTYTVTANDVTAKKVTLEDIPVTVAQATTIKGIPYGSTYTITETNGYGYQAENAVNGTVATVTNKKLEATVQVKGIKKVENPDKKDHTFNFSLTEVDAQGNAVTNSKNNRTATATFKGESGEFVFDALKYETSDLADMSVVDNSKVKKFYYQVKEVPMDPRAYITDGTTYTVEVTLTGKQNELTADITKVSKTVDNVTTVVADETIRFDNTILGTLTVKKSIYGGDANDNFKFQLKTEEWVDGAFEYEKNGVVSELTFTKGVAEFHLRDGESLTLYGLPHGLEVQVHEVGTDKYAEFYKVNSSITREGQTVKVDVESKGTTVKYINYEVTSSWLPQTGQLKWPVLVLAALGIGFIGFGFLTKKRKKNGK